MLKFANNLFFIAESAVLGFRRTVRMYNILNIYTSMSLKSSLFIGETFPVPVGDPGCRINISGYSLKNYKKTLITWCLAFIYICFCSQTPVFNSSFKYFLNTKISISVLLTFRLLVIVTFLKAL